MCGKATKRIEDGPVQPSAHNPTYRPVGGSSMRLNGRDLRSYEDAGPSLPGSLMDPLGKALWGTD